MAEIELHVVGLQQLVEHVEGHVEVVSELLQREASVDAATKVSATHFKLFVSVAQFNENSALSKNLGMLLMKYSSTLLSWGTYRGI